MEQPPPQRQGTLTRQQTFPPVQPYARMRYLSTTAEMSQCCPEVLHEADSSSSRSTSPAPVAEQQPNSGRVATSSAQPGELRRHSTPTQSKAPRPTNTGGRRFTTIPLTQDGQQQETHAKVFFIGSPPDSPPRLPSATPSSDSGSGSLGGEPRRSVDSVSLPGNKRDYGDGGREKSSKMLKLMKENVDPRAEELAGKGSFGLGRRPSSQVSSDSAFTRIPDSALD